SGALDDVEDALRLQSVGEIGLDPFASDNGFHKVGHRVHEGMLVANEMARRPPISHVWMVRFRNNNVPKSARLLRISCIVETQPVHFLKIEGNRTAAAVDFKSKLIFAATRKTRRFYIQHRPVPKLADHADGIIDVDASKPSIFR